METLSMAVQEFMLSVKCTPMLLEMLSKVKKYPTDAIQGEEKGPEERETLIKGRIVSVVEYGHFLQGVDQEILPCGQGRIDSVKINPSLLMIRE